MLKVDFQTTRATGALRAATAQLKDTVPIYQGKVEQLPWRRGGKPDHPLANVRNGAG